MKSINEVAVVAELLMLGIIPGTNIQINFENWLTISTVFIVCGLVIVIIRHRRQIFAAFAPLFRYIFHFISTRGWLLVLRLQLAWQLRKSATLL